MGSDITLTTTLSCELIDLLKEYLYQCKEEFERSDFRYLDELKDLFAHEYPNPQDLIKDVFFVLDRDCLKVNYLDQEAQTRENYLPPNHHLYKIIPYQQERFSSRHYGTLLLETFINLQLNKETALSDAELMKVCYTYTNHIFIKEGVIYIKIVNISSYKGGEDVELDYEGVGREIKAWRSIYDDFDETTKLEVD